MFQLRIFQLFQSGNNDEAKREQMERLVREELERWDSESSIGGSGRGTSPTASSNDRNRTRPSSGSGGGVRYHSLVFQPWVFVHWRFVLECFLCILSLLFRNANSDAHSWLLVEIGLICFEVNRMDHGCKFVSVKQSVARACRSGCANHTVK